MINQFGINIGFYMLMPYLADYLAGPWGAAWAVGLVIGVLFSQRACSSWVARWPVSFGYNLIIAGCLVPASFALLVVACPVC